MARRKLPEQETSDEARIRHIKEIIANTPSRSDKISWERKSRNIQTVIEEELTPIEDQILSLLHEKGAILAKIAEIREQMATECVHPFEHLEVKEDYVLCLFCGKKIGIPPLG